MKYYQLVAFTGVCVMACMFWLPGDNAFYAKNYIVSLLFFAVMLAFGCKLQKLLKISISAIKYPLAFALSLGVVGTLFFIAGFAGLYNPVLAYIVLVVFAAVSYPEIKELIFDAGSILKRIATFQFGSLDLIVFAAGGFVFTMFYFLCVTPPVYYDTLVYHMAVPQQYIEAGRIINMKENVFSYYPQLMQMNCLFLLLLSDELSVKLVYLFMSIMSMAVLAALADEVKADKKISILLLIASPLFIMNASRIGAELPLMFFTLLFIYVLVKAAESGLKDGYGLCAGIIAGMIMSVKYTGVVVYAFGAAFGLYMLYRKKAVLKDMILYLTVPAVIVMPYLVRNYVFTGDPFYPFFSGLFSVESGLKMDASGYVAHVTGFGMPQTAFNLIKSLFDTVYNPRLFGGDVLSPLLLASFVLLPLTNLKKTGLLAVFTAFYFITWFYTGQVLRFLLPVVPLAAVMAAQAFFNNKSKLKYIALGILVAAQVGSSIYFGERYLRPLQLFVMNRQEYEHRNMSYYKAANFINNSTPRGASLLILGDARSYFIKRQVLAYTVFNGRKILDDFYETDGERFVTIMRTKGMKYMLLNRTEMDRLKDAGFGDVNDIVTNPEFNTVIDKYFVKIYSDNNCDVYELQERQ